MSIVKRGIEPAPAVVSESAAILSVIERAASNPNVDIDKLERLLEMRERVEAQTARKAYSAAMSTMRPTLPAIKKDGAIDMGRGKAISFAKWEDINDVVVPILGQHGFSIWFRTDVLEGKVRVTCVVSHEAGHSEETSLVLPADTSGSKNAVQSLGSSVSYGKRYTASALLNLTTRDGGPDRDDDGLAGGVAPTISAEQIKKLRELCEKLGKSDAEQTLAAYFKVDTLEDLPVALYARAERAIQLKIKGATHV